MIDVEPWLEFTGKPYEEWATGPDTYNCTGVCLAYLRKRGLDLPDDAFHAEIRSYWQLRGALDGAIATPDDVVLSLNEEGSLHVDVVLPTRQPRSLTALRPRGTLVRPLRSIFQPIGVYTFAP